MAENGGRLVVLGRAAYLHTPAGFGRSRLAARFDNGLSVPSTARNWNKVLQLLDLVTEAERA